MSVLIGLWLAKPVVAETPTTKESTIKPVYGPLPTEVKAPVPTVERKQKSVEVRRDNPVYEGRTYSKDEVVQLIKDYSAQYGINPEVPLCIAKLESGYNQFSKNKSSTASGVFQYLSGTWAGTDEARAGLNVFEAEANVRAAIKYMASRKNTRPWVVANKCPSL